MAILNDTTILGDLFVTGIMKNITDTIDTNVATADKVNHPLVLKVNTGTTEGTNLYTFDGSTSKSLDIKAGSNIILTATAGILTIASTYIDTNYYPTSFSWTNGTTAGPTGSLTGTGMSAVLIGAIPSASATISGIVTTGAQTFAGDKSFNGKISANHGICLNTQASNATGLSLWFSSSASENTPQLYCNTGGATGCGVNGTLVAPTGTLVTGWATRSLATSDSGYGWTFEKCTRTGTNPAIVAELDISGNFKTTGNIIPDVTDTKTIGTSSLKWNNIYATTFTGNLTGNAVTATSSYALNSTDTRSVATNPDNYNNQMIFQGIKQSSVIGNPSASIYSYLLGLRGWSDSSSGNAHEIAFNDNGIYTRNGSSLWGNWQQFITSANIASQNAGSATKLQTARTIALIQGATGTATAFDGTSDISIPVTSLDASALTGTASVNTTGNALTATTATTATNLTGGTVNATSITGPLNSIISSASITTTEPTIADLAEGQIVFVIEE